MYEVELKVPAAHDALRERLVALDADSLGRVHHEDTYYDAPHRAFEETDEALRVRRESDESNGTDRTEGAKTTKLTYKGPLVETASKTRLERETGIEDPDELAGVLHELGFSPAATVEKDREKFSCGGYVVALNSVRGLGEFVEVEREVETDAGIDAARDGAYDLLRDLGCDPEAQLTTSYLGLLVETGADSSS